MFCTKCGKELYDGDRFCAFCGAEVRRAQASKNDEVVFNPPFKLEAQKKTEEILKAADERKEKETAKRETVAFDWNLDGFPKASPKKTEDVNFNWDSVLEKRAARSFDEDSFFIERITPTEVRTPQIKEEETSKVPTEPIKEIFSSEELEKELFGLYGAEVEGRTETQPKMTENEDAGASAAADISNISDISENSDAADDLQELHDVNDLISAEGLSEYSDGSKNGSRDRDSRFYTFNKKSDEFEELLNKERERIRSMEDEYKRRLEDMDYTWVPEVFKSRTAGQRTDVPVGNTYAEPAKAESTPAESEAAVLVEVIQPQTPNTVDLTKEYPHINIPEPVAVPEQAKAEEVKEETKQEEAKQETEVAEVKEEAKAETVEKDKLRYSDVFPRVGAEKAGSLGTEGMPEKAGASQESGSGDRNDKNGSRSGAAIAAVFDDEDEEPVKKHIAAKVIVAVLLIALLLEGGALAIKFFAPDSRVSAMIDTAVFKIADLFTGGSAPANADGAGDGGSVSSEDSRAAYFSNLVIGKSGSVKSIGSVSYNPELTYGSGKEYSFAEISEADSFVDAEWKDAGATYGEKLLESVIKYYDGWIDTNSESDLIGINTLEIGEIRTGKEGFYVLCEVTYAAVDGEELSQYQTVFVKISNGLMVINEIKEETL